MPKRRKTIRIPAPIANVGDRIMVFNYRKQPEGWEPGEVTNASWSVMYGLVTSEGRWTYEVLPESGGAHIWVDEAGVIRMEDYRA